MCFSEEASFTAAVAISIVAGAALHEAKFSRLSLLALTPLFFALQQLSEGLTWLHLKGILSEGWFSNFMREYYFVFAYIGWPIWVSLSLLVAEKIRFRRVILTIFLLLGIAIAGYNFMYLLDQPVYPVVANQSIRYETKIPYQEIYIYGVVTLLPWFFSSLKGAWLAGLVFLFSFLIAGYFYEYTMTSVWCFFAAIVSIIVFKIVMDNQEELSS